MNTIAEPDALVAYNEGLDDGEHIAKGNPWRRWKDEQPESGSFIVGVFSRKRKGVFKWKATVLHVQAVMGSHGEEDIECYEVVRNWHPGEYTGSPDYWCNLPDPMNWAD